MKALKIFALATLCVVLATSAFAQSDRGTITGTVTDENGGVIPGAAVVAVNADNGSKYETVTTTTRNYTLAEVPIGIYNLAVDIQGFGRFRQEGIRIFVAQTARVDAKLKIGALAEEVNVVADASMLRTESAEISSSITSENLNELPLNFGARGNQAAAAINPLQTQTRNPQGVPTAGYGRIDTGSTFGPPRAGQIVARVGW